MIKKSWHLPLESIKPQYFAKFKESKEFMSRISYLPFSALLKRHRALPTINIKSKG